MVFALFVFFYAGNRKMWVLCAIFFWAALLGYSRIYLGVHYWLDVECGYLIGALCFLPVFRRLKPTVNKYLLVNKCKFGGICNSAETTNFEH
jgi:undecaprenyl-diphosphatase